MKTVCRIGGVLGILLLAGCVSTPVEHSGPNSIAPVTYGGWPKAFRLENDTTKVVIVPETGRMMYLGLRDGVNVLRNDAALMGRPVAQDGAWANTGGDWLWPVAQSHWADYGATNGPPPEFMSDAAWEGEAWREPDGRQSCLLIRRYGAPVNALIMRRFTLDPGKPLVTVGQRMVATADSAVPLTLWSVAQIDGPQQALFPVRASSQFPKGYSLMLGQAPPGPMTDCNEILTCDLIQNSASKLGVDAAEPWIAARKYDVVIVVRARHPFSGEYPDRGCSIQVYSAGRNQYAEIETLSPEFVLRTGESIGNTLTIELMTCPPGMSPCRLAELLRPEEK